MSMQEVAMALLDFFKVLYLFQVLRLFKFFDSQDSICYSFIFMLVLDVL